MRYLVAVLPAVIFVAGLYVYHRLERRDREAAYRRDRNIIAELRRRAPN